MELKHLKPTALFDTTGFAFSQAVLQRGGALLHIAGQTAWDRERRLVGGNDVAAQTRQTLINLKAALSAVGATPAHIVRLRTYVVKPDDQTLSKVIPAIEEFYGGSPPAPNTWLWIVSLAMPDFLIEIEATAAID
jgi:enamine deaminase RidA (YjgF/YER057c/UK114 family)